jgi:hypothetical protein
MAQQRQKIGEIILQEYLIHVMKYLREPIRRPAKYIADDYLKHHFRDASVRLFFRFAQLQRTLYLAQLVQYLRVQNHNYANGYEIVERKREYGERVKRWQVVIHKHGEVGVVCGEIPRLRPNYDACSVLYFGN